ncbi:malate synthase A [Spirilliplanes yamanashiensis]|uniref:Malate synthase n=1 Tax=Spirilliplanes yamanashiensis TaxID=42233 RepID=A0A8J3YAD5_9ACTN|nr:malate synthase A [Spirilliplanes yamanashiensis]MDP9818039.1 malate synthase [Spirilliplanes yamanashiensis]GIJ04848.1 malate synthase [Spirilliplanes yamanashiensis]
MLEPVTVAPGNPQILKPDAIEFIVALDREFGARRVELLERRRRRRSAGTPVLDFRADTAHVRADPDWRVAAPGPGLADRRVEITGPPERKMTINALNSGAQVWMADFEDALSPTWDNIVEGQQNLVDALDGTISWTAPDGRRYELGDTLPTVMVRPRGWHLPERHVRIGGRCVSGSLFDAGMYLFHCARRQIDRGSGPYFYLPKLEDHREARLWNDVFVFAQEWLGIPRGTIRATVLIETLPAAFQMEEILYELREHSAGLNAGRWDYLFSMIKNRPDVVLPYRGDVTMTTPFMRAYTELLVSTCHRRGAHAIGGMAAAVPSRDPQQRRHALATVRQDKRREVGDGFDGSWVAHPGLVETCREVFDQWLRDEPNQVVRRRDDVRVTAADLLADRFGDVVVAEAEVRANAEVAVRYVAAWLDGRGAVALNGLMEDAATAEISRAQLWQWARHGTPMTNGLRVDLPLVRECLEDAAAAEPANPRFAQARALLTEMVSATTLTDFLTLPAYARHLS